MDAVDAWGAATYEYAAAMQAGDLLTAGRAKDSAYRRALSLVFDLED